MKEVTYEDWLKNPTPRVMWVWDKDEKDKIQRRVIYFIEDKNTPYPVVVLSSGNTLASNYKYCAEIEEAKTRRMTNKELSRWLREKPTREWKYNSDSQVYTSYGYKEEWADEECWSEVVVREDDGEWREPLVEVEE